MKERKIEFTISLILYLFIILYITILCRTPGFSRVIHLEPLWSYKSLLKGNSKYALQILLNIALFIPLGFFFRNFFQPRLVAPIILLVSVTVEGIQYFTYRGLMDVDDPVSNLLGGIIGILIYVTIGAHSKEKKSAKMLLWMGRAMLVLGFIGCIITAIPKQSNSVSDEITSQFEFYFTSEKHEGNKLYLEGSCRTYYRDTPGFQLFLDDEPVPTEIRGDVFIATVNIPKEKTELRIRFNGYPIIPTGTWINRDRIEYVAENVAPVNVDINPDSILKAYSSEYDTFVYQVKKRLIWYIGWNIDSTTEIIYHLYTDEPEKLPEKRIQYKFDNRGFRIESSKEREKQGQYRVFEDIIPEEYHVTSVVVGFNTKGKITWGSDFRIR